MRRKRTDPDSWTLIINGAEHPVREITDLRRRITAALRKRFAEVGLFRGELPEHNFFALFNRDRAVLSYTRNISEASYSAWSTDVPEGEEEKLEFCLSNGQCDEYSLAETIPAADAARAFEYFFEKEELPPWIKWQKVF
jgi:hypothetical protein